MSQDNTLLTVVTSGALTINSSEEQKEIYSEITVLGASNTTTTLTVNGTSGIILAGGTKLNIANIRSLNVTAGAGVLVKGYKLNLIL